MGGIDSLMFLKVLCDFEKKKINTIPDDVFVQEASSPIKQAGSKVTPPCVVKVYMQEKYGVGGPLGSKRYACPRCSCLFPHKHHLRQHLELKCTHKCLGCSECFAEVLRSFKQVKGERIRRSSAFPCSACPNSFQTQAGLAVHKECHPPAYKCESCSKQFDNPEELQQHQKTHVTPKRYKCKECAKTFSSASNRSRHVRLTHKNKKRKASGNLKAQISKDKDSENEYSDQDDEDEYDEVDFKEANIKKCGLCSAQFSQGPQNRAHACPKFHSLEDLNEDMFHGHFQCPACSQVYSSYIAMKMHWGGHLGHDPLTCTNCDKKFSNFRRVDEHFELHGKNTCKKCGVFFYRKLAVLLHDCGYTHRCFTCNQVFPTKSSYTRHLLVHPLPKDWVYKCTECKKSFMKESYFRAHRIEHTGTQPFACSICDQKFLMFGPFKKHVVAHMSVKGLQCNTCGECFRNAKTFDAHVATHVVKVEFLSCDKCHTKFETEADFKRHACQETTNERVAGFQCKDCSMVFRREYQLFVHQRNQHGKAPPYLLHCDLCSRGFYHKLHLQSHKMHCASRNEEERKEVFQKTELEKKRKVCGRPFQCTKCGRKYFTQKNLDEHMYVHRDDSECPYQCPTCGVGYAREYYFRLHTKKCAATNEKKNSLRCKECGATFLNERTLKRHARVHGNEWECDLCHDKFLTKRGYEKHQTLCTPESAQYKTFRKTNKLQLQFTCPTCERQFKLRHRYEAHVASHKGIMQYQCPTCFHKFMSSNNFKRHKCNFQARVETKPVATVTKPDSPVEEILPH